MDLGLEADVLAGLAYGLAVAGQWDRAEQTAQAVRMPLFRMGALYKIASALAAAGIWDRAEQVADRAYHYRAKTLATVAAARADPDADEVARIGQKAEAVILGPGDRYWRSPTVRAYGPGLIPHGPPAWP